jgi:hypothetical protein
VLFFGAAIGKGSTAPDQVRGDDALEITFITHLALFG